MKISNYFKSVLLISVIGIVLSIISLRSSTLISSIPGYDSFCNLGEGLNCTNVLSSKYSYILGIPLSIYGSIFFFIISILAFAGIYLPAASIIFPLQLFGLFGFVTSLYYFFISKFILKSFCIVCIGIYIVNLLIFILGIFTKTEEDKSQEQIRYPQSLLKGIKQISVFPQVLFGLGRYQYTKAASFAFLSFFLVLIFGGIVLALPSLLWKPKTETIGSNFYEDELNRLVDAWRISPEVTIPISSTEDYAMGSPTAPIKVVEFSDYECSACRQAYKEVEKFLEKEKERVFFVLKQFPLDQSCNKSINHVIHNHACFASDIALCGGEQGKFWGVTKMLFNLPELDSSSSRSELERAIIYKLPILGINNDQLSSCLTQGTSKTALENHINQGISLGIRGTPSLFINGRKVPSVNSDLMQKIVENILKGNK